jgi:PAS domain S-box-containing protein
MGRRNAHDDWLEGHDPDAVADFWRFYETHYEEITCALEVEAQGVAVPPGYLAAARREMLEPARRACVERDFAAFDEAVRASAIEYAKRGVSFETWSRIGAKLAEALRAILLRELAHDPARLGAVLRVKQAFLGRAMITLGTTYVAEKEAALAESLARTHAVLDAVLDAIVVIDEGGTILDANRSAETTFGHSKAALIGAQLRELIPCDRRDHHDVELARFRIEGRASFLGRRDETTFRRADGSVFPAEVEVVAIQPGGRALYVGCVRDVTQAKRERSEREAAVEALERSERQLRALAARLDRSLEEERTRIAREIHDELGQHLTGLKLDLAWLARRASDPTQEERLGEMSKQLDTLSGVVRRLATELRPGVLDDLGLEDALDWQAREFGRRAGIEVRIEHLDGTLALGEPHATALFRSFQEILTNVARHAGARTVTARVARVDGRVILEVADDGRGITDDDIAKPTSLGLVGLRERAAILGGLTEIQGRPGGGTTVRITLPVAT